MVVQQVVNVGEAKATLSRLLVAVEDGEEIVIGRNGRPIATLSRYEGPTGRRDLTPPWADEDVWIADDFDETPDWLVDLFEGGGDATSAA